jgi:hypothetical protein
VSNELHQPENGAMPVTALPITVEMRNGSVRVLYDGLIHISFRREDLIGIQSWRWGHDDYWIEYTLKGGSMLTEYDSKEKFEIILRGLNELRL